MELSKEGLRERGKMLSTCDGQTLEMLKRDKEALSIFNALAEVIAESKEK